jgi:hypothetical protein
MTDSTKERSEKLQALAAEILAASGADVTHAVSIRPLAKLMETKCDAVYETCKRHIAKAVRRARGQVVASRGGLREGAGRPVIKTQPTQRAPDAGKAAAKKRIGK